MDRTPTQWAAEAIELLGGPAGVVKAFEVEGLRPNVVRHWLTNGVPAWACPEFERTTRALGRAVLCEQLRPDIKWGVLRAAPSAATVAA